MLHYVWKLEPSDDYALMLVYICATVEFVILLHMGFCLALSVYFFLSIAQSQLNISVRLFLVRSYQFYHEMVEKAHLCTIS